MLYIFAVIFVAITNFYYVGINHSVDFYYYISLYNKTIVSYGYQRKLKNRNMYIYTYMYIYIYIIYIYIYIYIYIILRKQDGSSSQKHLNIEGRL